MHKTRLLSTFYHYIAKKFEKVELLDGFRFYLEKSFRKLIFSLP